jgi:Tol biopolymer transport system component
MDADGANRRQLTTDFHRDVKPSVTLDGRYVVFESNRTGQDHIWRMDIDGRNEEQLTNGHVERDPLCSADGKWVVYNTWETGKQTNSKVAIEGGQAIQLTESEASEAADVSPDGRFKLSHFRDEQTNQEKIGVIRIEDGVTLKIIDPPSMPMDDLHWARNEQALTFLSSSGSVGNIWLLPLDGGQPRQLTNFKSDGVLWFSFSPDGKQLACSRGTETRDVVMISNLR